MRVRSRHWQLLISNNSKAEEQGFALAFAVIAGLILTTAAVALIARSICKTRATVAGITAEPKHSKYFGNYQALRIFSPDDLPTPFSPHTALDRGNAQ